VTGSNEKLERLALRLEYGTIAWNVGEAAVSIGLGIAAGSLALIGFGSDSLIEVFASLVVVWHLKPGGREAHAPRTARALRLVGGAFTVLAALLILAGTRDLVVGRQPDPTLWGTAYLVLVAAVMLGLGVAKRRVALELDSPPLRAEAAMSMLDAALAAGTAVGLALHVAAGWWWADPAAALIVAVAAINEARESFEESREWAAGGGAVDQPHQ